MCPKTNPNQTKTKQNNRDWFSAVYLVFNFPGSSKLFEGERKKKFRLYEPGCNGVEVNYIFFCFIYI